MQSEASAGSPAAPKGLKMAGVAAAVIAVGVVAAGTISRASDTHAAQSWSDAQAVPTVHLVDVTASGGTDTLTLPGTMQAWNGAHLFPRVNGYVKAWYKDIGADVSAGAPLGEIDTPELDQQIVQARAEVASARANAGLARNTAARWNDLLASSSVSRQEADEKNADLTAKNAAVQGAEANLGRLLAMKGYATVRAPFAGLVTLRNADIGDLVGPGLPGQQPMFALADVHRIRLYVNVPQSYSAAMKQGETATLTVPDYPGKTFDAQVIGTSGAINGQTGTLQVQLAADNPGELLKPGGYAQVRFVMTGHAGTVQIPSTSLIFRSAGTQVATVAPNGRIRLIPVTVGRDLGSTVEISGGLHGGERIVDSPPDSIAEDQLVRLDGGQSGMTSHG
jgi:RND family efflux transporter MFP subunit